MHEPLFAEVTSQHFKPSGCKYVTTPIFFIFVQATVLKEEWLPSFSKEIPI